MDSIALRERMLRRNVHNKDVARELGISLSALQRKLRGTTEFSRGEIKMLISYLGMSNDEVMAIFFDD